MIPDFRKKKKKANNRIDYCILISNNAGSMVIGRCAVRSPEERHGTGIQGTGVVFETRGGDVIGEKGIRVDV